MAVIYANSENFDEVVSDGLVLLDFYADWCGPCKMLAPVLDELSAENEDIKVVKVNVDENRQLAVNYGVQGIPALFVLKDGVKADNKAGFMPKQTLVDWVKSL